MKKLILSLALAAGTVAVANAQAGVTFGVKAGASLTNFSGDGTGDLKNIFGFNGGLIANLAVNDAFSIQPELLYSMKGAKSEETFGSYTDKNTVRLHYIDVPVLARVNAAGLFFELGPQIGFLVAANNKEEISGGIGSGTYNTDVKSSISSVDFGYAAGLGYQVSNGPGIGLRYNGGFTDLAKNNSSSSSSTRNSAFQLYLSYMFGGK